MTRWMLWSCVFAAIVAAPLLAADEVGVVCNVKVVSDKVKDVSSLDAWKKSYIKDGMSDKDKALAIWETVVAHQHQDSPPTEFLQNEDLVLDPVKLWNVYGYSFCGVAASEVEALARQVGLEARGWTINCHVVPEVKWDNSWHLLDSSLINYFLKADGSIASVDDIMAAAAEFYKEHPDLKGNDKKLREFHFADGKKGWKKSTALLTSSPTFTENGWYPAKTHGWYSMMQEYDGSVKFEYECGYSLSYRVNIQLRPGEKLTRNWSNKGLHLQMNDANGNGPGCMKEKVGTGALLHTPKYGDLAVGRVGNGTLEYAVPVGSDGLKASAWTYENLKVQDKALKAADASKPGVLVVRMPTSYIYLTGKAALKTVGDGKVTVSLSDNNGLDWKPVATIDKAGDQDLDLGKLVSRRYDYQLKFELTGSMALAGLNISHDIQHSQRPLPALDKGENTITFSAGPQEGTIAVEGAMNAKNQGKQLVYTDFHPAIESMNNNYPAGPKGSLTFPIKAPGDITRLRMGCFWIGGDPGDGWNMEVSYDGGKTFKTVEAFGKSVKFNSRYKEVTDVPAGTKEVLFRATGIQKAVAPLLNLYCSADYKQPGSGFRPVKITYVFDDGGTEKKQDFVAKTASESFKITCQEKPVMKSIVLELAD